MGQEIGEQKEVQAISIDVETRWDFNQRMQSDAAPMKRLVQRSFEYTPPSGWVILTHTTANEFSRSGSIELYFEEGGLLNLTEEDLAQVYQILIDQANDRNDDGVLANRIKEDYKNHRSLFQNVNTDLNRLTALVQVESHGHYPDTRVQALQNNGVMRADVHVSMIYLGSENKDQLLEELAIKYGLQAVASL